MSSLSRIAYRISLTAHGILQSCIRYIGFPLNPPGTARRKEV